MIENLQYFLSDFGYNLRIDGIAGPKTLAAFKDYEKRIFKMEQEMIKPTHGRISSPYGPRIHPVTGKKGKFHNGIDIVAPVGQTVFSPADGKVTSTYDQEYGGLTMIIKHDNGSESRMAHLSKYIVSQGDEIKQGDPVAEVGNTGRSTGAHLHYGMKKDGEYVDPQDYLKPLKS